MRKLNSYFRKVGTYMDTCVITVRDVRNAVFGRAAALRKFVADHPELKEEHREWTLDMVANGVHPSDVVRLDPNTWIASKGFKILDERAFVTYEDGMYYVDVMYTISM
jgi:hypothetical protein